MPPDRVLGQARLNEHEAFRNLTEALKVAETSARQLALQRDAQWWIMVAATIEGIRGRSAKLMTARAQTLIHPWVQ